MSSSITQTMNDFVNHCKIIQKTLIDTLRCMEENKVEESIQGSIMESRLHDKLRDTWKLFVAEPYACTFSSGHILHCAPDASQQLGKQNDIMLFRDSSSAMFVTQDAVSSTCECKLSIKQKSYLEIADQQIQQAHFIHGFDPQFEMILVAFQMYHTSNQSSPSLDIIRQSWIPSLKATQNFFVFYNDVKTYKNCGPYGIVFLRKGTALADELGVDSDYFFGAITNKNPGQSYFVFMMLFLSFFYAAKRRIVPELQLNFEISLVELMTPFLK